MLVFYYLIVSFGLGVAGVEEREREREREREMIDFISSFGSM